MLPCLAAGAVLGADTQGSVLWCGGAEEGHVPTAEGTCPAPAPQHGGAGK